MSPILVSPTINRVLLLIGLKHHEPIFKILSPADLLGNLQFHLTCSVSLHYLVKFINERWYRFLSWIVIL